ncbi:unnamed protein product [Rhizophagus irregularis]|nr:unnamed protein product [Rhizophagus irregularis]
MNGIIFDIIGFLSQHIRAVGLRGILFYAVSPIADESFKYSNICGEWADSSLQEKYQEPCVVFAEHPSLRSGAAINFIRKQYKAEFTELIYECLNIVNISINSQFVRAVMTENLASNIVLVTNLGKIR